MAQVNQDNAWNRLFNTKTVKHRLLIRIGLVLTITWFIAVYFAKSLAWHKTMEFFQDQTQSMARSWVELVLMQNEKYLQLPSQSCVLLLGWRDNQLVFQQGEVTFPKPTQQQTYVTKINGNKWVISTLCKKGTCVLVGLKDAERKHAVRGLIILIFLPLLIIFGLAMWAMNYAVRSGLQPLNTLAEKVSSVSVDKLTPFSETTMSKELLPLVQAINQLMSNMNAQLLKERQFLDTCTHELRTPVTALVSQIQSLGFINKEINTNFQKVSAAALRVVRVANQFLSLAKSNNAGALANQCEKFDLCELFRQVIVDLAIDHDRCDCQMDGLTSLLVYADPLAMEMVCKNLVENALLYGVSPDNEQVKVMITCEAHGDTVTVTVEDAGPGVEAKYREKLLHRFYRVPGKNSEGAGLGLSIVKEVALRYEGNIILDKSLLGGLKVTVSFKNIQIQGS
ncbi:sensor histidine kinase [Spartinivicinus ruber]|uniref:sensor histidine kinase n=1 Tax=Spartinivicinus ruber TaxID=2683272 RepID=UPI0013D575A9|nr:HAMP domain-containing sensor histidine kinase [Spartinivicinus ruber]